MRDLIFVVILFLLLLIALKLFLWTVKTVLILAVLLGGAYFVLRAFGFLKGKT